MNKEEFLQKVVFGYLQGDLTRMVKTIRPVQNKAGNINFPLALFTLSCMDYLGSYLHGRDKAFMKNIQRYLDLCFTHPQQYPVVVLKIFRDPLAHRFFLGGGVSRGGRSPALTKTLDGNALLDVEVLVSDFLASLPTFAAKLDDNAFSQREAQLMARSSKEEAEAATQISNLPPIDFNLSDVRSGASTYPKPLNTTTFSEVS